MAPNISCIYIFRVPDCHQKYHDLVQIALDKSAIVNFAGVSYIYIIISSFLKSRFYAEPTPNRETGMSGMQNSRGCVAHINMASM